MYLCAKAFFMLFDKFMESSGVSIDTRTIKAGDLFFALKGDNFNGNEYALEALNKGAKYAIVDDTTLKGVHKDFVFVDDVLGALQELAHEYRNYLNKPVIALTGSNGKTTTKELINIVLSSKYKVHCTKGNFNNHIGVPLTILSAPQDIDFLLIEMGANHQGEIHNLCTIADPDFGLITNIGKAHLEGFGGIEGVKKGKSELYRFISKKGGFIFCNKSDLVLSQLLPSEANCIEYFDDAILNGKAEFLNFEYKNTQFSTHLFGGHNLSNALVAIEIGIYFGVDLGLIAISINKYIPENNRSQKTTVNDKIVIKDSYNSNPSSLRASLGSLIKSYDSKQVVLILGDMLELGEYSLIEHHAILSYIQEYHFLDVWLIGEEFSQLANKYDYNFFLTTAEAKKFFSLDNYPPNSIIFLKGSRGIAVEKLLNV